MSDKPSTEPPSINSQEQGLKVQPSGIYTGEKWFRVAPFGSESRTVIKTYDPRVYPNNEAIRVAVVDPASEVDVAIAEANAELIVRAVNAHDALVEVLKAVRETYYCEHTWQTTQLTKLLPAIDDALELATKPETNSKPDPSQPHKWVGKYAMSVCEVCHRLEDSTELHI